MLTKWASGFDDVTNLHTTTKCFYNDGNNVNYVEC